MDPYKTLGVTKTATQDEVKAAYRKLAKKLHPDLNPGNKKVEEQFKEVNKAYELLGDVDQRGKFDRGETAEQQQEAWREQSERARSRRGRSGFGGGAGGFTDEGPSFYYETQGEPGARYSNGFDGIDPDLFESIFGGARGAGRGGARAGGGQTRAPQDQVFSLEIDFNTSIIGGEREITLPQGKKLRVKIPAGIKPGTRLRLAGQGEVPGPGGAAGDLFLEVHVLESPVFERTGNDLEMDLPLSLSEAILGAEVKVQTVDGAIMLKVPPGVSSGSRIRIRAKGVPYGGQRGDIYAIVKVVMPAEVDPQLTEFFKTWSKAHPHNPRTETPGGTK